MNNITLTIPNDDHIALRAFGKALEEMALAHGAEPRKTVGELSYKLNIDTSEATAALERLNAATGELMQAAPQMMDDLRFEGEELHGKRKEPEIDTSAQQVESLAEAALTINGVEIESEPASNEEITGCDKSGTPWDERIHSASKALNADGTWRLRRKPKDMDELEWSDYVSMIKADLQYPVECGGEGKEIDEPTGEEVDEASNKMLEPPVTHQNPVYMYQESRNVYALGRSEEEIAEYETKGYVRHTQEQYNAWEGPTVADEGDNYHTDAGVVTEQTVAGIPPLPVPPPVVVAPPVNIGIYQGGAGTIGSGSTGVEPTWDFPRLMTFLTERHGKIDVATVNTLLAQDGMSSVQELNAHPDKIGPFVARVKAHLGEYS